MSRQALCSYEELVEKLNEFCRLHPNGKITLSALARETDVPRYVWRDNKKIKTLIDTLNDTNRASFPKSETIELPSAYDLVNTNYDNKDRLIEVVGDLLNELEKSYQIIKDNENIVQIKKSYEEKIAELNCTIEQKDNTIKVLNKEIDELYLDSKNPLKVKAKGLTGNLIETKVDDKTLVPKDKLNDIMKNIFD